MKLLLVKSTLILCLTLFSLYTLAEPNSPVSPQWFKSESNRLLSGVWTFSLPREWLAQHPQTGALSLFSHRRGRTLSIPFQIERHPHKGFPRRILPHNLALLDPRDHLFLRLAACGEAIAAPPATWKEIPCPSPMQTRVIYVTTENSASVANESTPSGLTYTRARDEVQTPFYKVSYHQHVIADYFAIHEGADILDRSKLRYTAKFLAEVPFSLHEEGNKILEFEYLAGPIRVLRHTRTRTRFLPGYLSPVVTNEVVYYDHYCQTYALFHVAMNTQGILDENKLTMYYDLSPAALGAKLIDADANVLAEITPDLSHPVSRLPDAHAWLGILLAEEKVGLAMRFEVINRTASPEFVARAVRIGDALTPDPPETEPGCLSCIGYQIDIPGNAKGQFGIRTDFWVGTTPDLKEIMQTNGLQVAVISK